MPKVLVAPSINFGFASFPVLSNTIFGIAVLANSLHSFIRSIV
tara:strand:+ start:214 stop:342 length:129 start_codon:yes stop_codon:yes gene_type:complete